MVSHSRLKASIPTVLLLLAALALAATPAQAQAGGSAQVASPVDGALIDLNWCAPGGGVGPDTYPVIIHSHGWGGSKSSCKGSWLDEGYAFVSVSARGFGRSDGQANVHDPDFEGRDFLAVLDWIWEQPWSAKETGDSACGGKDIVIGGSGGSYGGAFQFLMAFTEKGLTATEANPQGCTRMDALSPDMTWYSLPDSLAPNHVVRSTWVAALYGTGAGTLPQYIHEAAIYTFATGQPPDGTLYGVPHPEIPNILDEFNQHGPSYWVEDRNMLLDIPVFVHQGLTDNLFNLNQGFHNFHKSLTPAMHQQSTLVGYNGGHALPNVHPVGAGFPGGDPCSPGGYGAAERAFYNLHLKGTGDGIPTGIHMATVDGDCVGGAPLGTGNWTSLDLPVSVAAATSTAGAIQHIPLASGPMTIAGIPELTAKMTSAGVDARAFLGLSRGFTPADAMVLDNNVMPIRGLAIDIPVQSELSTELAGVAAHIPAGQTLFLTISATSDMFPAHGSREGGAILLEDIEVLLPIAS